MTLIQGALEFELVPGESGWEAPKVEVLLDLAKTGQKRRQKKDR